jgi:hypothetical protein
MVSYGGLYPAFVVDSSGNPARVRVPQVWQDVTVPLHGIAAIPAVAGQTGWVAFVNGQAEYPVWLGANQPVVIGGGGGGPSVPGLSAYQLAVQAGFEGDLNAWLASLVGPPGPPDGPRGFSAYEIAVQNGFVGSPTAWLASLHGADGGDGALSYRFETPLTTWVVNHNLARLVGVEIMDLAGDEILANVSRITDNQVQITHATPMTGTVVIS